MSNELKTCPFCDGKAVISKETLDERCAYANVVKVQCTVCGASVSATGDTSKPGYADNSTTEQRAIDAWNRRATSGAASGEVCMSVADAMRIVRANWGDTSAIERAFSANAPAEQSAPPVPRMDDSLTLPTAIMNIPCNVPETALHRAVKMAYTMGHRDARHAAADVALDHFDKQTANSRGGAQGRITSDNEADQSASTVPGQADTERDAFEAWLERDGYPVEDGELARDSDGYVDDTYASMWCAWQARGRQSGVPDDTNIAALSKEKP